MYISKVQKWGNSQGVRIPKYILDHAEISEGDNVAISLEDHKIILFRPNKALKKYTLEELFKDYKGDYKPGEYDWGAPVGKEEW
ncbi:MAG TPA: AbrB/MazE/SpoVT family DNA-binding domain-containing protein [Candidatus Diapherotrites archaeon]|jgi:antitoxin MazE|nr:AbrB/MazE/SpoVT family DNA-binding domain-containing protein [Candidatus Diapherotrites archaeon]